MKRAVYVCQLDIFFFFSLFSFFLLQPNETKGRPALFFLEKWGESFVRDEKEEGKKERKEGWVWRKGLVKFSKRPWE